MLGLVENVVTSNFSHPLELEPTVRSASGGRPEVVSQLRRYLRDVAREHYPGHDIVVVAMDGNCHGFNDVRNGIMRLVDQIEYPGSVVCAVPDPHIESWYLSDPENLARTLGSDRIPKVPPYKCERAIYKGELSQTLASIGVKAPLGGTEYGREIAQAINLFQAGQNVPSLKQFVDDFCGTAANFLNP
jgi:hypothetical protein